jgi:hypothetical protein
MCISDRYYAHSYLTNCGDSWLQLFAVASYTSKKLRLVPVQQISLCYFEHGPQGSCKKVYKPTFNERKLLKA